MSGLPDRADVGAQQGSLLRAAAVALFFSTLFAVVFAAPIAAGRLLAPGDGWTVHIPAFLAPRTLWASELYSGFPIAAEPLTQTFYPPAWLFAQMSAWNAYVVLAYVLAASFTCGYVVALTGSITGGLVAGTIYSMSGFYFGHLGHSTIIHGAAWIPLLFWSLERQRQAPSMRWIVTGAAAVALCSVGAHPQVLVYGLGLAGAYALASSGAAAAGRWRYLRASAATVCAGLGLAAMQLVLTAELGVLSLRAQMTLAEAAHYALPPAEAIQLLFPFLFGGAYAVPYFGTWGYTETGGYIGWPGCLAAITAILLRPHDRSVRFWLAAGLIALLLAFGPATPIWHGFQALPGYSWFRCAGRHLLELTFAVAVLAGVGVAALQSDARVASAARRAALGLGLFAVLAALVIGTARAGDLMRLAAAKGVMIPSFAPWTYAGVGVPLVAAAAAIATWLWLAGRPNSTARVALWLAVMAIDLWTCGRQLMPLAILPERSVVDMPAGLEPYRARTRAEHTRVLTAEFISTPEAASPNINRLWGIANVNGASSVPLLRYAEAVLAADTRQPEDQMLDLLATRYLLRTLSGPLAFGIGELGRPSELTIDARRNPRASRPVPDLWASHVRLTGSLGRAAHVPDGSVVGWVRVETDGETITHPLRAGDDLSESAYDRSDVRPFVRHRQAPVVGSEPIPDPKYGLYQAHTYLAVLDLGGRRRVRRIEVEAAQRTVKVRLRNLALRDDATGQTQSLDLIVGDGDRWRRVGEIGSVSVFENQRPLARAWLATETVALPPAEILKVIRTSRLPDGRVFDARRTALVETAVELPSAGEARVGSVTIQALSGARVELQTDTSAAAFLVLGDVFYPGWQAHIDGYPVRIHPTDYLLRGVEVPAGRHTVTFVFQPRSFVAGVGVSAATVGVLLFAAALTRRPRPRL